MTPTIVSTYNILEEVLNECERQESKWGIQRHPLIGPRGDVEFIRSRYQQGAEQGRAMNDSDNEHGTLGWDGILLEEVYEALAEDDVDKACEELVQVAAVCVSAIRSLRQNGLEGRR